ncbi:RNA 3'-terminal phosphate cyclase domain-containing protein [Aspergillus californicus]
MAQTQPAEPLRLDGRTLEGGGQLVRIAVALSALTGRAITIDKIRGNRQGKKGLKASHLAAVQTLGELTGSTLVKAQVGSCSMGFYPPSDRKEEGCRTDTELDIRLPTPGSVFLVFQALYPYLLNSSSADQIRLSIIGGTNASCSPSYDYVSQVLIPNFMRLGLPAISLRLEKRGWSTGQVQMGKVTFVIDTLRSRNEQGGLNSAFPPIDLHRYRRGSICKIDITILAPDDRLAEPDRSDWKPHRTKGKPVPAAASDEDVNQETIREFMERETQRTLRKQLKRLPPSLFSFSGVDRKGNDVPIEVHTSEATHYRSCLYLLIVAHTSTGFRIGRDVLYGSLRDQPRRKKGQQKIYEDISIKVKKLVEECVERFTQEFHDPSLQTPTAIAKHQPCVDEHMRDQLVVFEALGRASGVEVVQDPESQEDERYWSLHTKTAQWVCREMLGAESAGETQE